MDEDGNLTIIDAQPVLTIHVAELGKPVEWNEKGWRKYLKGCYESTDRNRFKLSVRKMHLEILQCMRCPWAA